MAEVKNSFLASKMNKDLDDRLIPGNEYKDALNIAVSNSEDSDVGAVENILQNTNIYPISSETNIGNDDGKIIGQIVNPATDDIYLFYTNYTDPSTDGLSAHQASSSGVGTLSVIVRYNPDLEAGVSSQLVIGRFLNFSENSPIYGINIIEDFLFWTDDRNQPRKINIRKASANRFHYSSEDDISVAKYAPYTPIDLYKSSNGGFKTTMKDVSSEKLPDGTTNNPDYNPDYAGDSNFLEDKFARFSYRFKYEDAEYSIMAPFTQIAFIPKQDGSFLAGDEDKAFQSTVVSFMENKVDQISLVINLPEIGTNLKSAYKLKEIDILYKESDQIAISVLDTVTVEEVVAQAGSTNVYEYNYQSRKPVRTLPQTQSTRVYDKTPVRALAQEVSGNRVIYGNYINKHTAPDHLNYQVSVTQKFTSGFGANYSYIEYPEHTLKRNRNYQVGFVLSDRYGRQSDVILSQVVDNIAADGIFGSSTFYFPYRKNATTPTTFLADVGNSIKIQLNEQIQSDRSPLTADNLASTGEPGLYDLSTNPTGWYSYKIVVKQTQQEYYNVYLPGFLKGDITTGPITATHSVLISDNINKVPRDLQEVGPVQNKYSSDEVLFPVVENVVPSSAGANYNQPFFPENKKYEVTTIASFNDLNNLGGTVGVPELFETTEDPLIMRIGDNKGGLGGTFSNMLPTLSIAETTPFVSNIDIYYETSTSGLISDLNTSVIADIGTPIFGFSIFDYTHRENQNPGGSSAVTGASDSAFVTSDMFPVSNLNSPILTTSDDRLTVTDNLGQFRNNEFELVDGTAAGSYRIKIKNSFYFGADANTRESYNFTISLRNSADNATANSNGTFSNVTSITVQNVVNTIFVGQTLVINGTSLAKVTGVDNLVITFNTSIDIPTTNTALQFQAPINTFTKQGALSNSSPLVAPPIAYVTPAFSTMTGLYATITAYNGAFSAADRTKGLQYRWSTLQPLINGAFTDFTINTVGANSLITIGNNQITLAVDQYGKVSIDSGFFNFSVAFSLNVTITDVGGLSTEATIVFDDVTAGAFTNAFSTAFDI